MHKIFYALYSYTVLLNELHTKIDSAQRTVQLVVQIQKMIEAIPAGEEFFLKFTGLRL